MAKICGKDGGKYLPINNYKRANILRRGEILVASGHDEADDTLCKGADGKCVAGPDPVRDKGTKACTGDVEEADDSVPAKRFPERGGISEDKLQPDRGVDGESIGGEVIDEPD